MNRLSRAERAQIIRALVEGNSIRSTARMTGAARNTITTLLVELGTACAAYQDRALRNLTSTRIECDEIWAFCYAKAQNVPEEHRGEFGYGDVWTWTAIDPDTKLVPSWLVGQRDGADATLFLADLALAAVQPGPDHHGRAPARTSRPSRRVRARRGLRDADQDSTAPTRTPSAGSVRQWCWRRKSASFRATPTRP